MAEQYSHLIENEEQSNEIGCGEEMGAQQSGENGNNEEDAFMQFCQHSESVLNINKLYQQIGRAHV